jgi:hypothetical protein
MINSWGTDWPTHFKKSPTDKQVEVPHKLKQYQGMLLSKTLPMPEKQNY